MPVARLIPPRRDATATPDASVPSILHTPSGLALVEIQGTVNIGSRSLTGSELKASEDSAVDDSSDFRLDRRQLGRMEFEEGNRVVLDMGLHQRLRGKLVPLAKPVAVLSMTAQAGVPPTGTVHIPVVEIIRHKVLFNSRPEPLVY